MLVVCVLVVSACAPASEREDRDGPNHAAQIKATASAVGGIASARRITPDTDSRTLACVLPGSAWTPPSVTPDVVLVHHEPSHYHANDVLPPSSRGPP